MAWALLGEATRDESRNPSLISTLIRVLASLGPAPEDDEAVLKEIVLRGRLAAGFAPATDAEWERAEQIFDDDALAEFHRWAATEKRLT